MQGIFRGQLSGIFPAVAGENEIINFVVDPINQDFDFIWPGDLPLGFQPNQNILLISSNISIAGAVGARVGLESTTIPISTGRQVNEDTFTQFNLPFVTGKQELNTLMKITPYAVPLFKPIFTGTFDLKIDSRNVQSLYYGAPVVLDVVLTCEF